MTEGGRETEEGRETEGGRHLELENEGRRGGGGGGVEKKRGRERNRTQNFITHEMRFEAMACSYSLSLPRYTEESY